MKKLFKVLLVALMACSVLVGCSSSDEEDSETTTLDDEVISVGTLYIGTSPDFPPFESYDTDGNIVGFEIDLINAMAPYFVTDDGEQYTIELVAMDFSTIISALQTGQVDIGLSGFSYSPERQCLFSTPIVTTKQVIVVQADSEISTLEDLNGMLVGACEGTTCYDAASEIEGVEMVSLQNHQIMFEMLAQGQLDALAVDEAVALGYVESSDSYKVLDEVLVDEEICIICAEGNEQILEALNNAIAAVDADGTLDALKEQWGL